MIVYTTAISYAPITAEFPTMGVAINHTIRFDMPLTITLDQSQNTNTHTILHWCSEGISSGHGGSTLLRELPRVILIQQLLPNS